ncbi:MAG: hypothetical protein RQ990_00110 [Candidatus Hydrothermia bacterium]|jgi:hypothetical protein|nr:hypothetical protein [Candidatus Hydrothermia bacterium]
MLNKFFIISIDTECDKDKNWKVIKPLSFIGVYEGVNILEKIFDKYNIRAVYLLSPEVIYDEKSVLIFKDLLKKNVELGTHLHGEFIEPNKKENIEYANEYTSDYEDEIEFEKLKNLTELFIKTFHFNPISYRAGRFSISNRTYKFLKILNYKVDSSVAPFSKISDIDHTDKPDYPYFVNGILEVPITVYSRNPKLYKIFRNSKLYNFRFFRRIFNKFFGNIWVRPSNYNFEEMKFAIEKYERKYKDRKIFINIMFHNVEVIENLSPYDSKFLLKNLEMIIIYLTEKGYKNIRLMDVYDILIQLKGF